MEKNTILITGGTGYLGTWVVHYLLKRGFAVKLALRSLIAAKKFAFFRLMAQQSGGTLELVKADLMKLGAYDAAAQGCDAIIHMAFPSTYDSKDVNNIIRPGIEGTKNILRSANKSDTVKKVVITSCINAVYSDNVDMQERDVKEFTAAHFNHTCTREHQPEAFAKVEAEELAWDMYKLQDQWKLTILNPTLMLGPNLSKTSASRSLQFIKNLLSGTYFPKAPDLEFGIVDVRDVAIAHVATLINSMADCRYILSNKVMSILQMATQIEQLYPQKFKLPKNTISRFMMKMTGTNFGFNNQYIERNIGHPVRLSNQKSQADLGLKYRPIGYTFKDMIKTLQL